MFNFIQEETAQFLAIILYLQTFGDLFIAFCLMFSNAVLQSFNGLKTLTSLWRVGSVLNQITLICKVDMVSWWKETASQPNTANCQS